MVHLGDADALVAGVDQHFPDTIRPALQVIKPRPGLHRVSGLYVLVTRRGDMYFLADCTVNIEPSAEIWRKSRSVRRNSEAIQRDAACGDAVVFKLWQHRDIRCRRKCSEPIQAGARSPDPTLMIEGEMMADTAVAPEIIEETYPFSKAARRGERAGLSGPDVGEYVLQTARENWRSRGDWADPDGNVEAGACTAAWSGSRGDREHRRDCGSRCTRDGSPGRS